MIRRLVKVYVTSGCYESASDVIGGICYESAGDVIEGGYESDVIEGGYESDSAEGPFGSDLLDSACLCVWGCAFDSGEGFAFARGLRKSAIDVENVIVIFFSRGLYLLGMVSGESKTRNRERKSRSWPFAR